MSPPYGIPVRIALAASAALERTFAEQASVWDVVDPISGGPHLGSDDRKGAEKGQKRASKIGMTRHTGRVRCIALRSSLHTTDNLAQ